MVARIEAKVLYGDTAVDFSLEVDDKDLLPIYHPLMARDLAEQAKAKIHEILRSLDEEY